MALAALAGDALSGRSRTTRAPQYHVAVDDYVAITSRARPAFIRDPQRRKLIASLIDELGGEPHQI